jgi:hypothetical protein
MIEAQAILLTVSALIRCIGEGSISGRCGPSKAGQSWSGFINERIFYFFLTESQAPCLTGQIERLERSESCFCEREFSAASPWFFLTTRED